MKFRFISTVLLSGVLASTLTLSSCVLAQDQSISKMPGELILNPGFEDVELGTPNDWIGVPFVTTLSSSAHTGAHSLKIESKDVDYAPVARQEPIAFEAGRSYRLQYDVRADRFGVEYRGYVGLWRAPAKGDPDDAPPLAWIDGVDTDWRQGSANWQHVSVDFTPPAKANRMMITLQVKGPGVAWFDNVSITPQNLEAVEAAPAPVVPVVAPPQDEAVVAATDKGVKITADRRFLLDGRPFFPIQIWGWTPYSNDALATAREWGFNIVGSPSLGDVGPSAARAWMDAAQRQGLHVMIPMVFNLPPKNAAELLPAIIAKNEKIMPMLREHPATFSYNINDEPAWAGYDVPTYNQAAQWLKAQDASHPIFVNHAPRNTIAELKRYNQLADIAGSDIYPVWRDNIDRHSDLPNKTISVVGDETRKNLTAVDGKKPVMQTLQAFSWSDGATGTDKDQPHPFPTRRQLRFMGWDSIVAGATGIAWFADERYKQLRPEMKPVVREFAALQDVLAGGESVPVAGTFAGPIQAIAWKWKGKTVLVAINVTDKPVQAKPNWKSTFGMAAPALRVLWENRSSGASESFSPFDVHIYTDAARDDEILRAGFEIETIGTPVLTK